MKILINGIGGPTPRSIVRALRWYSHYQQYEFIGTDINPYARDLYDSTFYNKTYLVPPAGHPDYWHAIEQIIGAHQIDMALVQPELEVIAWAKRAEENALPCKALLPGYTLAKQLTDKGLMTNILKETGWVPPSVIIKPESESFDEAVRALGFPFWIRATSGSSGLGALKVENESALRNWIHINPKVRQFIGSQYLPGRNLACKLLYFEGQLLRAACAERVKYIMAKVAPSGVTGNTSFGRLLNEPKLVDTARQVMDRLFAQTNAPKHGFFTLDFKEDEEGRAYVTEVNIRHVAFSVCFAAGGANFAEDTVRLLNNDATFDQSYRIHTFEEGLIFLRDVDAPPLLMKESQIFLAE
jgi:carbamoyl-phosphate synthase large subunit